MYHLKAVLALLCLLFAVLAQVASSFGNEYYITRMDATVKDAKYSVGDLLLMDYVIVNSFPDKNMTIHTIFILLPNQ